MSWWETFFSFVNSFCTPIAFDKRITVLISYVRNPLLGVVKKVSPNLNSTLKPKLRFKHANIVKKKKKKSIGDLFNWKYVSNCRIYFYTSVLIDSWRFSAAHCNTKCTLPLSSIYEKVLTMASKKEKSRNSIANFGTFVSSPFSYLSSPLWLLLFIIPLVFAQWQPHLMSWTLRLKP